MRASFTKYVIFTAVTLGVTPAIYAANTPSTAKPNNVVAQESFGDIQMKSDQELTELTARWGELDPAQRRALIQEVRTRMARPQTNAARSVGRPDTQVGAKANGRQGRVTITRRYGRIVRKPDGSVVVQTRVVPVQELPLQSEQATTDAAVEGSQPTAGAANQAEARPRVRRSITFGFGFERRRLQDRDNTTSQEKPPAP